MAKKKAAKKKTTRKKKRVGPARRAVQQTEREARRQRQLRKLAAEAKANARRATKAEPPPKKSTGMPRFRPTEKDRAQVETMAGLGMARDMIAILIENPRTGRPIDVETLEKYFGEELLRGPAIANSNVGQAMYDRATGDSAQAVQAGIWWEKTRTGMREKTSVEVDIKSGVLVAPGAVSPEEWVAAAVARTAADQEPGTEDA